MKIPGGMTRREVIKWGAKLATIGVLIPSVKAAVSPAMLASARRRNTGGGPVLIASTTTGGTSAGIDTTDANFIAFSISGYMGGPNPTVTDSNSNTWTSLTHQQQNNTRTRIYYCYSPTVGSGHTFTANGSWVSAVISAWSGIATSPFDLETGATGGPSTTINTGSITPSQDSVLVITNVGGNSGSAVYTIDSGYTIVGQITDSSPSIIRTGQAYKILTSASSQNPQWTSTLSVSEYVACIASFKA